MARARGVAQRQDPVGTDAGGHGGPAQGAPQHRQHRRRGSGALRHGHRMERAFAPGQALLGPPHQVDHPVVALLGRGAEGEQAVLQQHHALGLGAAGCRGLPGQGRRLGQGETGHHVGHQGHPIAVDLPAHLGRIGLVGQGQQGDRVGVIHKRVGQEGVQQSLHRGVGGGRIDQVLALGRHHRLIAEGLEDPQGLQGLQPHRRMARRLDRAQVPARSLDAQHPDRLAQQTVHGGFHRGVAAAVQHQLGVGPQQPGRVGAQGQVFVHPLVAVAGDRLAGGVIRPAMLHGHGAKR